MNAETCITESQRNDVAAKVAEVEAKSAAEVVCAVTTESGRYDRSESIVGAIGSVLALFVLHVWAGGGEATADAWIEATGVPVGLQAAAVAIGFIAGSVLASYVPSVRRLFTSDDEMAAETDRAANHVFCSQRLSSTRQHGGVLVYISLFERQIRILVDEGGLSAVDEERLHELVAAVVPMLKGNDVAGAFDHILNALEAPLAETLPATGANPDELSNEVRVYHPRP
jgi:uncharacterized membrane protein